MTADLVERLRAALDEHERYGKSIEGVPSGQVYDGERWMDVLVDGAHVLRTVQAHRKILDRYETALVARDAAVDTVLAGATRLSLRVHEETVRLIAAVYLPVPDTKEDTTDER